MVILIVGPARDAHVQAVSEHLRQLGRAVQCFSISQLLRSYAFELRLGERVPVCNIEALSGGSPGADRNMIAFHSAEAVWLRRASTVKSTNVAEPWAAKIVECEATRAMDGALRLLKDALWVNHPAAQGESSYKLRQLERARLAGLAIPETLVTNKPEAVVEFYEANNRNVIYKMIDELTWQYFPQFEIPRGLPTLPLGNEDLKHIDQVKLGLHLFQERIEKQADIRVTIVGHKIFAVRIESQKGKGAVDFRLDYTVPMEPYELPDDVSERCLTLMRQSGLNYGAIDLCLDREGRHVFLEVNAQGQWLWMEMELGVPIAEEVAKLLAGMAPPLVPPA